MYERGWGLPMDLNQAHRWYGTAVSLYSPGADKQKAERARKKMSALIQRNRIKAITRAKSPKKRNLSIRTLGLFYTSCAAKGNLDSAISRGFSQDAYCLCVADELNDRVGMAELISLSIQMSTKGDLNKRNAWQKNPKLRDIVSTCMADNLNENKMTHRTQRALNLLGYDVGLIDGRLGPRTKLAINQFQINQGLVRTGSASNDLANELQRLEIRKLTRASLAYSRSRGKPRPQRSAATSGTGFAINRNGDILTNNHVVRNCKSIMVGRNERRKARIVAHNVENDLAVVRTSKLDGAWAKLIANVGVDQGERIVVFGYPLQGALSSQPNITTGIVSGLAGLRNDIRYLRITAPVQQGNSGGPLLNQRGSVIGIVTSKLDAYKIAKVTGDIPQNVNFAIKSSVVKNFLDAYGIQYEVANTTVQRSDVELAKQAREFTTLVECR